MAKNLLSFKIVLYLFSFTGGANPTDIGLQFVQCP
jgi:hypothetical protein